MKPAPFEYHDPASVGDVVRLLGELDNTKILAGGQSLVPMMNFRYVMPDHVIDINGVSDLSGISVNGGKLHIGAVTRQRELEFSETIEKHCPLIQAALVHVGHRQTRNRGTIGGSLSHADPAAELPTVCSAMDAVVYIEGPRGPRSVPFADFNLAFMTTAADLDEIVTAIELDLWREGHGFSFQEFARRHGDFAIVGVAALLEMDGPNVSRAALAVCGVSTGPVRLRELEEQLRGLELSDAAIVEAAAQVQCIDTIDDHHADADYRRHLARVLTERALREARSRAKGQAREVS